MRRGLVLRVENHGHLKILVPDPKAHELRMCCCHGSCFVQQCMLQSLPPNTFNLNPLQNPASPPHRDHACLIPLGELL